MCQICNPQVQRMFQHHSIPQWDIRITYYSYNNYFKICCLDDYYTTIRNLENAQRNEPFLANLYGESLHYQKCINLLYKNKIITVHKDLKINKNFYNINSHTLTINIINITEDIILESEVYNKLNTIQNLEIINDELKLENDELKLENVGINSLNKKLKSENYILKKEVEYYNSLKPKYDYNEMKQNKKILHNEYKRIYKLIKKNIGFNLC